MGKTLTARRWQCRQCSRSYSVTVNTIFHNSHIDLQRWYLLISLMLSNKVGLSSIQAARDLNMRQPTVWSMMQRISKAMTKNDGATLLAGLVKIDGTQIGGAPHKPTNRNDNLEKT